MIRELPPQPQGTAEQQLAALRDYLVRLAQSLDEAAGSALAAPLSSSALQRQNEKAVRDSAETLKALIVKTAEQITERADRRAEEYKALYVAQSDFGSYYSAIESQVCASARGTVESFRYDEAIEALERYTRTLDGQIRRGAVEDPYTHEIHLGIAISEKLSFTGETVTADGLAYRKLAAGQTLGLYTSKGWQFWIGGVRSGWFSSEDSMLHIANLVVEERLQLGASWEFGVDGGFGLRYTGG